jgi:hypothetical protein
MNRELRHALLDLVLSCSNRATVEFDQRMAGTMSVVTWKLNGKIEHAINSWNYNTEQEFFEQVKQLLK